MKILLVSHCGWGAFMLPQLEKEGHSVGVYCTKDQSEMAVPCDSYESLEEGLSTLDPDLVVFEDDKFPFQLVKVSALDIPSVGNALGAKLGSDSKLSSAMMSQNGVSISELPSEPDFCVLGFFNGKDWMEPALAQVCCGDDIVTLRRLDTKSKLFSVTLKKMTIMLKAIKYCGMVGMECMMNDGKVGVGSMCFGLQPLTMETFCTGLKDDLGDFLKGLANGNVSDYAWTDDYMSGIKHAERCISFGRGSKQEESLSAAVKNLPQYDLSDLEKHKLVRR